MQCLFDLWVYLYVYEWERCGIFVSEKQLMWKKYTYSLLLTNNEERAWARKENRKIGQKYSRFRSNFYLLASLQIKKKLNKSLLQSFFPYRNEDAASESASDDLQFFVIGYILVITYLAVMLGSFSRLSHKVGLVLFNWFDNIAVIPITIILVLIFINISVKCMTIKLMNDFIKNRNFNFAVIFQLFLFLLQLKFSGNSLIVIFISLLRNILKIMKIYMWSVYPCIKCKCKICWPDEVHNSWVSCRVGNA